MNDTNEPPQDTPNDQSTYDPFGRGRPLYRTDDHVGGVAGGVAEYFGIDPSLARVGTAALVLTTGPAAIFGYLAAWLILPDSSGSTMIGDDVAPAHPTNQETAAQ